jgi:hypothetical protein
MRPKARVEVDAKKLADLRRVLNPKQFRQATYQAVLRTTNGAVSKATDLVQKRSGLPRRYISGKQHRRAAIVSAVYKGDSPEGRVRVREIGVPLSAYKFRRVGDNGIEVTFDQLGETLHLKHAFVATVASRAQEAQGVSHKGIFSRSKVGTSAYAVSRYLQKGMDSKWMAARRGQVTPAGRSWRLPIEEHFGWPVLEFVTKDEIRTEIERHAAETLDAQIDSQVRRFTEGRATGLRDAIAQLDFASGGEASEPTEQSL